MRNIVSKTQFILLSILFAFALQSCSSSSSDTDNVSVSNLYITPTSSILSHGETLQLTATVIVSNKIDADVTQDVQWSSNNPCAAVDPTGRVRASETITGTAEITAQYGNFSAAASIEVRALSKSITAIQITPATATIEVGETLQYSAWATYEDSTTADITPEVTWQSSDTSVAGIDASGLVHAVEGGVASITANYADQSANIAQLTVRGTTDALVRIDISPNEMTIAYNEAQQYTAIGVYADGGTADLTAEVAWTSSDTAIANIDAGGLALSERTDGTTNIQASHDAINSNIAVLTVHSATPDMVSIDIRPNAATIQSGATQQYSAVAAYTDGSTGDVTSSVVWNSTNPGVAAIDAGGLATGVGAGGATNITASNNGITSDTALLTVTPAVSSPVITNLEMYRGATSENTEMELWNGTYGAGGVVIDFSPNSMSYYAYVAGFDQVTLKIYADNADTLTVNGVAASSSGDDYTVTFTTKGENAITIYVENAAGNATYTITVHFLDFNYMVHGLYADYMNITKSDKWHAINPLLEYGDRITIDGNVSGQMYWRIAYDYTVDCDDVVTDEADRHFGGTGSDFCGYTGRFDAFNRISLITPYNDGNAFYAGTQNGNSWSGNWHLPANEGGMVMMGDSISYISDIFDADGEVRGRYSFFLDNTLILIVYQHYVIEDGYVVEDEDSYTDFIYMPAADDPDGIDNCAEAGGVWCEEGRILLNYDAPSPW